MGIFISVIYCILKMNCVFIDFESYTSNYESNSFLIDSVGMS